MREVTRDEQFPEERRENTTGEVEGVLASTDAEGTQQRPSETELVIVALLMRLYDVNMALLSHFDKATADSIYDAHNEGGHFNPQIFVPDAKSE